MLKNVTITLEEQVLRRVRVRAAEKGKSVSKLIGEMLEREIPQTDAYWLAFERWKKLKPILMTGRIGDISREELHERRR